MNKKIYFNDSYIEFTFVNSQGTGNQSFKQKLNFLVKKYDLKKIVKELLEAKNYSTYPVSIKNFEETLEFLKAQFYYIEAAGGVIEKEGTFLFINRLGKWDLPKGKLDIGESIEDCAVRECEEECGVKNLNIVKKLPSTFHIYPYKKGFALKQTHWFQMKTSYSKKLVPQLEEDINEVRWMTVQEIEKIVKPNTYKTILDVIENIERH